MQSYVTTIDVPIAFIKDCIKNEYYDSKATPKYPGKTKFHNFDQNSEGDFDELERLLLDN